MERQKWKDESGKTEVERQKWKDRSGKTEMQSQKWKDRNGKAEMKRQKQKGRNRGAEVESRSRRTEVELQHNLHCLAYATGFFGIWICFTFQNSVLPLP